jgi:hypothetical protein
MTRTLKSMFALTTVAIIIGQAETVQRFARQPRNQEPPPVFNSEPARVLVRACGNCHSSHTDWPWYSHVAPVSWWIAWDVRKGRERLDWSERETYSPRQRCDELESICGLISTGRMPPRLYRSLHPEARLNETEKKRVCSWVKEKTLKEKAFVAR